jgi:hypothetical protein
MYPRLPDTFEERRDQLEAALRVLLDPGDDDDDDDRGAPASWWLDVIGTYPDHVIVVRHTNDTATGYDVPYTVNPDGVRLGEPEEVTLTVVAVQEATGEDTDVPVGDLLPLPELVEQVVNGFKTLDPGEVKAGRVLSGANADRLRAAVQHLVEVLAAAGISITEVEPPPTPGVVDTETTSPSARDGKTLDAAAHREFLRQIAALTSGP